MARSLIAAWFALSITFPLISKRTHYFSASKIDATSWLRIKQGHMNEKSIKRQMAIQKNVCGRTLKTALTEDLALYSGERHESAGVKKARPWARLSFRNVG
jgi:hypothetical protein